MTAEDPLQLLNAVVVDVVCCHCCFVAVVVVVVVVLSETVPGKFRLSSCQIYVLFVSIRQTHCTIRDNDQPTIICCKRRQTKVQ